MLRVRVLGELALERDGRVLPPPRGRRGSALLAWLAVNPGMHPRSQLAGRFWPDVLEESARSSLRAALSELRRALRPDAGDYLIATRDRIGLADSERVWVDARAVAELEAEGRLLEAAELCRRGELLAGFDAEWVDEARGLHAAGHERILAQLAAAAAERGDHSEAIELSRERLALDPLSEEAARALITRLAAAADLGAALAVYERLRERLRTELGLAPSAPTRALIAELRRAAEPVDERLSVPPRPALLRRRFRSAYAGRERERELLLASWERAREGERELALITGEPGIGKTRLAIETARSLGTESVVLYGRCHEDGLVPYRSFVEALGASAPEPLPAELAPLLPSADPPASSEAAGPDRRYRFFDSVDRLLGRIAALAPTLLVLDDLHWADEPTLRLLVHIARSAIPIPLLIVATYRDTELAGSAALSSTLADLRRDPGFERARLGGLDEGDTARMIAGWVRIETVPTVLPHIQAETDGSPFLIEELLADMKETGKPIDGLGVPEGVRDVVRRRIHRLPEPVARLLSLAAVIGRDFQLDVLARIADRPEREVEDALENAEASGLLQEEPRALGRYSFSHALIRDALYEELTATRRIRLHAEVAVALEHLEELAPRGRLEQIAHHYYEAAPGGSGGLALDWAERAATKAMRQLAYEDAASHCARALELLDAADGDDPARRCELELKLGGALLRAGRREPARIAFDAAAELARRRGDGAALAAAALGYAGIAVTIVAVDAPAVALLEEALAAIGEDDQALRARLLARLAIELYYAPMRDRSAELSEAAIAAARASGDTAALGLALNARHVALWRPDRLTERLRVAEEMDSFGDRAPEVSIQGVHWRLVDLFEAGDFGGWRRERAEHARRAERLRLPAFRWYDLAWAATECVLAGRFEAARRPLDDARREGEAAEDSNAELFAAMLEHSIRVLRRAFDEVDLAFAEEKVANSPAGSSYLPSLAWIYAEVDRIAEAHQHWHTISADRFAAIPFDVNWLSAMAEVAEAATLIDDAGNAAVAYDLLAPYADRTLASGRATTTYGSAEHHLGLLALASGRPQLALEHLRRALAVHEGMNSPPLVVGTLWRQAQALAATGERARAKETLERARRLGRPLGVEVPAAAPPKAYGRR